MLATYGLPAFFLMATVVGVWLAPGARAASYTWDGGGTTNNWSDCANWSSDICPVAADTVTFNATSTKDSVIDGAWGGTLTSLTIANGYTGTVSMQRSLTLSGAFVLGGTATFTANSYDLTSNTFSLSAGVFNAPSTTQTVNSTFSITGGIYNHNSGTFVIAGSVSATIACNNATFNLVQFSHTVAATKSISSNCSLPLGQDPTVSGRITLSGQLLGQGTLTLGGNSTNTLNSTAALVGFTGFMTGMPLNITGGTFDFGSYTLFDVNSSFTLAAGATFVAPNGTASFASAFAINGTFDANGGIVQFDGNSATLSCGNTVFNRVILATTKTVGSNCDLPLGHNPVANGTITLNGTLTGTGTLTVVSLVFNSSGVLDGFDGLVTSGSSSSALVVNGGLDLSNYNLIDLNIFTLNSGATLTAPAGEMSVAGAFTLNNGSTFNANGGTIIFDGSTASLTCNNSVFNYVEFQNTGTKTVSATCQLPLGHDPVVATSLSLNGTLSGSGTIRFNAGTFTPSSTASLTGFTGLIANAMTVNGTTLDFNNYDVVDINASFTLNSGAVFTAPAGTMSVASSFILNAGTTFNHNNGTLLFDGSGGTFSCNNTTFNLVVIDKSTTLGNGTINASCTFPLGHNPTVRYVSSSGGWTIDGRFTGSGVLQLSGTAATFRAPGGIEGFNGIRASIVNFDGGTVDMGSFTPAEFRILRLRQNVNFTAPSELGISTSLYINEGPNFNANGGIVVFRTAAPIDDSGTATLSCNNAVFNLVRFEQNIRMIIESGCTVPLGHDPVVASELIRQNSGSRQDFRQAGTLVGTGTLTVYGILRLDPGYQFNGFSDIVADNVTVNGSGADLSIFNSAQILKDLSITDAGTLTAPPLMYIGGNIAKNSNAVFNHNNGSVILNGGAQQISALPSITFNNLSKTNGGSLAFLADYTTNVVGQLNLRGGVDSLLSLNSATPGTPWNIAATGAANIRYVSVEDSVNIGPTITAFCSESLSDNPGWQFSSLGCNPDEPTNDPTTNTTNFTAAIAAAVAAAQQQASVSFSQLPRIPGLPSRLNELLSAFPGGKRAIEVFGAVLAVGAGSAAVAGGAWWAVSSRRRHG